MTPTIDGTMHHFSNGGVYDAVFTLQDAETKTIWNHITGEALHGPLVGRTLGPVGNLLQMDVKQALAMDPKMAVAISSRPIAGGSRRIGPDNPNATLQPKFVDSLGQEDTRRPRMEVGLGIWDDTVHRYYPMDVIRQRGGVFLDEMGGRTILIYIEPETSTPAAVFVKATKTARRGDEIHLDNGTIVRSGVLLDRGGKPLRTERPQQIFTRWYGFALTFPGCEIALQTTAR